MPVIKFVCILIVSASSLHGMLLSENEKLIIKLNEQIPFERVHSLKEQCFREIAKNDALALNLHIAPRELLAEYKQYSNDTSNLEYHRNELLNIVRKGFTTDCCLHNKPSECAHHKNISKYLESMPKILPIINQRIRNISLIKEQPEILNAQKQISIDCYTLLKNLYSLYLLDTTKKEEKLSLLSAGKKILEKLQSFDKRCSILINLKGLNPSYKDLCVFFLTEKC